MPTNTLKFDEMYLTNKKFRDTVDRMFDPVGAFIEEAAQEHGLSLHKWYNDLPVWLLEFEPWGDVIRVIHVGAAQIKKELHLTVLLDAYKDAEEKRYMLPEAKLGGMIPESTLKKDPGLIKKCIDAAYDLAKKVTEEELTEVDTSK